MIIRELFNSWTWRMAWRDARFSWRHMLLFGLSISLGVGALVAINTFGADLQRAIRLQSKAILGADLVVSSRQAPTEEEQAFLESLGYPHIREIQFTSMAQFPTANQAKLVQVRALEPGYPFYGELVTDPPRAGRDYQPNGVLIEESLLWQMNASVGDSVQLGQATLTIAGALQKVPGENPVFSSLAPRLFLPWDLLPQTGLLEGQSLARYQFHYQLPPGLSGEEIEEQIREQLQSGRYRIETVQEREQRLGRAMERLNRFLNLVSFISLLLGGIGIATGIAAHLRERRAAVALLRCLGAPQSRAFAVYLGQALALAGAGTFAGAAGGLLLHQLLPALLSGVVTFPVKPQLNLLPLLGVVLFAWALAASFALLPLAALRNVRPWQVLRLPAVADSQRFRDPFLWLLGLAIVTLVFGFALYQTQQWNHAAGFVAGIVGALALLMACASALMRLLKYLKISFLPYVLRQGLANLYRPNNRTAFVILALGLGTFLVLGLHLTQLSVTHGIVPETGRRPNMALFDIQPDQAEGVAAILRRRQLPLFDRTPIVSMRLEALQGRPVAELLEDPDSGARRWALTREYRSTFRSRLVDSETLVAGDWVPRVEGWNEPVPVSLEKGIAEDLNLSLGDELTFDIQGLPLRTTVGSVREVDWQRIQPNFFVVFPEGVLEEAPGFYVMTTRISGPQESAGVQREVVQEYPNVSVIDLQLVLQTIDTILSKITFVFKFLTAFTVITGWIILIGALITTRYQRMQEFVLLRTLGAGRAQVRAIALVEFLLLGSLAAVSGSLLAIGGSYSLCRYLFDLEYRFTPVPVAVAIVLVVSITVCLGMLFSTSALRQPPARAFQEE